MLESLAQTDAAAPEWMERAEKLVEENQRHMKEEELEIFPIALRVLAVTKDAR
jgi:hemerythrin-like domain-containing protein